jgi:hypothetical protein
MARFLVKYQTINPMTKRPTGTMGINVNASSVSEARQMFKSNHIDNTNTKYKIISVVKSQ